MRFRLGRTRDTSGAAAQRAIGAAQAARGEAGERFAQASEMKTSSERQAGVDSAGIIAELREMRRRNNLAQMILDSVEKRPR